MAPFYLFLCLFTRLSTAAYRFIDSQRQSARTRAMSLTHHSLMKIFRRIAANELMGARENTSMETGGNQKTFSHFLSHFD
jgi:hypothetical protein